MNTLQTACPHLDPVLRLLDSTVRTLMMLFIFTDRNLISSYLWQTELEHKHEERLAPGAKIILPTLHVGTRAFLFELRDTDFMMVDASGMERQNNSGRTGYIARFVFARPPLTEEPTPRYHAYIADHGWPSLERLCKEAMWQLCAFRNPRKDGVGISINCNARMPYKSVSGASLKPDKFLRISENHILLEF